MGGMTVPSRPLCPARPLTSPLWCLMPALALIAATVPVLALIAPLVHSALYGCLLVHCVQHPAPGLKVSFSSLEGIMPGFTLPDGAFAGWLHYCTFDPLVGLGIGKPI